MRKLVILRPDERYIDLEKIRCSAPGLTVEMAENVTQRCKMLPGAEVVLGWSDEVAELCLHEGTPLRFVQSYSTGVDSFPQHLLQKYGVKLATASGVHAKPVAETAFALMLALTRGLAPSIRNMQVHTWKPPQDYMALGEMHGSTLGILGAGRIGRTAAQMAKGFGMPVLGLRRSGKPEDGFDRIYKDSQLHEMLGQCDIVLNIMPLTDETDGIINAEAFVAMRPGTIYVSVGRGKTTDTQALVEALQNGRISAAGLDVTEPEPLPKESPLWDMHNVIILPHYGGFSRYQMDRIIDLFCENLAGYTNDGAIPRNLVDYTLEY